jgi:FdhD protein
MTASSFNSGAPQDSRRRIVRFETAAPPVQRTDRLAVEEPLEIRVRGRAVSVTMRTPGHDEELAAGFLLTEGLIRGRDDVLRIEPCDRNEAGNVINALLAPHVSVDFEKLTRHVFASSSCGLCGKATIDAVRGQFSAVTSAVSIQSSTLLALPAIMRDAQDTFDQTGGLHAAALFSSAGELLVLREDVGRHNAVDKVIGRCLLDGAALEDRILLVSGRASFEILQKALAARIAIVAAVSAPSSLAVDFAEANSQTLIGFLREGRMNVYSHPARVIFAP